MNIEEAKIGQTVYVKGEIIDIDKDEIFDLEIHTPENDFYVNSDDVLLKLDQPKPVVPKFIFDVIESFDEDVDYLYEHMSHQSDEVKDWLTHNERDFYEA